MPQVTLENITVPECLDIVHALRTYLTQHEDFDYSYHQYKYDWSTGNETLSSAQFRFKDAKVATMFALKYLK